MASSSHFMTNATEMLVSFVQILARSVTEIPFTISLEGSALGFCLSFLEFLLIAFHVEVLFLLLPMSFWKYNRIRLYQLCLYL